MSRMILEFEISSYVFKSLVFLTNYRTIAVYVLLTPPQDIHTFVDWCWLNVTDTVNCNHSTKMHLYRSWTQNNIPAWAHFD